MVLCPPRPAPPPARPTPGPGLRPTDPLPVAEQVPGRGDCPARSPEPVPPGPAPLPPPRNRAAAADPKSPARPHRPRRVNQRIRVVLAAAGTAALALGLVGPSTWQPGQPATKPRPYTLEPGTVSPLQGVITQ